MREKRRKISMRNLRLAFPKRSKEDLEKIGRASMQGFMKVVF